MCGNVIHIILHSCLGCMKDNVLHEGQCTEVSIHLFFRHTGCHFQQIRSTCMEYTAIFAISYRYVLCTCSKEHCSHNKDLFLVNRLHYCTL